MSILAKRVTALETQLTPKGKPYGIWAMTAEGEPMTGEQIEGAIRSLQRALHKDEAGRRITDPVAGPLFSDQHAEDDQEAGTIYVLRSKSDHPIVAANRDLIHKIGVTNMSVDQRIAGARLQPTFLMADVEVVATQ